MARVGAREWLAVGCVIASGSLARFGAAGEGPGMLLGPRRRRKAGLGDRRAVPARHRNAQGNDHPQALVHLHVERHELVATPAGRRSLAKAASTWDESAFLADDLADLLEASSFGETAIPA